MQIPQELAAALAGHYDLLRELGEGGMAVVYLATDLKHNREVAIKVLKSDLAAVVGEERFLGEIETTAKLQHPNILPLFDSGAKEGFLFYAMPYVEGETLRERLKRESQLPVEDALDLIQKVAAALDYAHEKGIVHRDIKPANILLSSGEPLIADFGIAIAVSQANDGRRTETGLSLGTPHYMSPEQAAGDRSLDPRSDVYALGCILQEMLTGEPPFSGANAQAVLARILTSKPTRVTSLRPTVPPHVESVIAKALEKLPADRFKSAKELRKALSDPDFRYVMTEHTIGTGAVPVMPATVVRRGTPTGVVAALGGLAAVALVAAAVGWLRPAPEAPFMRLPLAVDIQNPTGVEFAVSPDGSRFAYGGEGRLLYVRSFGSLEDQVIPGSFEAQGVTWSPDGTSLAFNADGGEDAVTYTTIVSGGAPVPLGGPEPTSPWIAWSDDGWVYSLGAGGEVVYRAPPQGGAAEEIVPDVELFTINPIPGHPDELVVSYTLVDNYVSGLMDVATGALRPIAGLTGASDPQAAGGYLFWLNIESDALVAARFDPVDGELTSVPVTLGQELGFDDFQVSRAGVLIHRSGANRGTLLGETLAWVDRVGEVDVIDERLAADIGDFDDLRLSPDGRYIAYELQRGADGSTSSSQRIQIYDLDQGTNVQLTFEGRLNTNPRWMADGRVAYLSDEGGETAIYAQPFDRSGASQLLAALPDSLRVIDFEVPRQPDLPFVLVVEHTDLGHSGLFLLDPDEPGAELRPFVDTPFSEINPAVSPDGRWIAYASDESDRFEVYVRAFPDGGRPWPISDEESRKPVWSPDGRDVIYLTDDRFVARALTLGDEVRVTGREDLFENSLDLELDLADVRTFDMGPEGRFLAIAERSAQSSAAAEGEPSDVVLLFNVFREIEERLAQLEAGR